MLHSQLRKLLNHDCKRYVEEHLIESGLACTILKPTHFMDMFPIGMLMQKRDENGGSEAVVEYPMMWNPRTEFSFVGLGDLGAAGAKVLEERERHFFATYEICSTDVMSYEDVCVVAGEVLRCTVRPRQKGFEEAVEGLAKLVVGEEASAAARDGVERMLLYYNRRGLKGNKNALEWLIGRKCRVI